MWEKRVFCFRKNTPKNQTELYAIGAIYIVVIVVLLFTLSFLIILDFILFYFILLFLPSTFSGTHVSTVRTGSYAPEIVARSVASRPKKNAPLAKKLLRSTGK